ncbi:MAG: KH domain-containing protein [bacterium]|nr:KH domain-containing protein [bacterium]
MAEIEQDFLEYVTKTIVEKPEKVEIKRTLDKKGVLLELTVDPEDVGKIIGKRGSTVNAVRTLLRVLGAKHDARFSLKVNEPEGGEVRVEREDSEEVKEEPPKEETVETEATEEVSDVKAKAKEGLEDLDDLDI